MNWSHASLEPRPPEWSVKLPYVMLGQTIVARCRRVAPNDLRVFDMRGRELGTASSPAEAMLMVKREHEQ